MSISQRLKVLVKFEGKQKDLAKKINSSSQSISQTLKHDRHISGPTLVAIAEAYPQLNMRWFLTGEGESGLEGVIPEVPVEDPEKEMLKEELLETYRDKAELLEGRMQVLKTQLEFLAWKSIEGPEVEYREQIVKAIGVGHSRKRTTENLKRERLKDAFRQSAGILTELEEDVDKIKDYLIVVNSKLAEAQRQFDFGPDLVNKLFGWLEDTDEKTVPDEVREKIIGFVEECFK